jgi:carotenoid 1,2-hydratase
VDAWAFSEYGKARVERAADSFRIGENEVGWQDGNLVVSFAEKTALTRRPLRGTVTVRPDRIVDHRVGLDTAARHTWCGVAPHARVEAVLEAPQLRFSGSGYHDANFGSEPLEDGFASWNWSRVDLGDRTAVLYDVRQRDGTRVDRGLSFDAQGAVKPVNAPTRVDLPGTGWRVPRVIRVDDGGSARVVRTLEDTPFYSRSLVDTQLLGESATAVHESLDLDRFRSRTVQLMLRFRMRRVP